MSESGFARELGRSGTLTFFLLSLLAVAVTFLFSALRPPTVAEVERDIWKDWARATVDSQGENIAGLLRLGRREACQRLISDFGRTVANHGEDFVVRTDVRRIRISDQSGEVFAEWDSPKNRALAPGWTTLTLPLGNEGEAPIGQLDVEYKFNESTLGSLPNIRRLAELHDAARWLIAILAVVMLVAAVANLQRLRERAGRLRSQQVTLDLARQMCHELRNGLWAFSLEGKNLQQLFAIVETYFEREPGAMAVAAVRIGMSEKDLERLRRQMKKHLAGLHLDPETDVLSANELARDSQRQIESFSRYINLTVEQLDRNLLGSATAWQPTRVQITQAWREALELLALRVQSAGVTVTERMETDDDWVWADSRALVHVFVNLIKNAVEAMREAPPPRNLALTVTREENSVVCRVRNVGKPIPEHLLPFVFQRGFSTKAGAGRGLGLALVQDTVTRMKGRLEVASDDSGTEFRMSLHFAPAPDPDSTGKGTTDTNAALPTVSIRSADDPSPPQ